MDQDPGFTEERAVRESNVTSGVHWQNLRHAMYEGCDDPDCEIHNPEVIETESERVTAMAWHVAGAKWAVMVMRQELDEMPQTLREETMNRLGLQYMP